MSINITMFVITSLFLFVILKDCSGHEIKGCNPDTSMDVDGATNIFTCVGIDPRHYVSWYVKKLDPSNEHIVIYSNAAVCTLKRTVCTTYLKNVKAYRYHKPPSSVLTVSSQDMSDFLSIGCRVYKKPHPHGPIHMHDYSCNLLWRDFPTFTCSLRRQQDNSTTVTCTILKIYILKRAYKCEFIVTLKDGTTEIIKNSTFSKTGQTRGPAIGTCMVPNLPKTGDIKNVEAILIPHDLHVMAKLIEN